MKNRMMRTLTAVLMILVLAGTFLQAGLKADAAGETISMTVNGVSAYKALSPDEVFTYEIRTTVPSDGTGGEVLVQLVDVMEFYSNSNDVQVYIDGTTYTGIVTINNKTLTVALPTGSAYADKDVQIRYEARVIPGADLVVYRNYSGIQIPTSATLSNSVIGTIQSDIVMVEPVEELIDVPVEVIWEDTDDYDQVRPAVVQIGLFKYDSYSYDELHVADAATNAHNSWRYTFQGLPKNNTDGTEIQYIVKWMDQSDVWMSSGSFNASYTGTVNDNSGSFTVTFYHEAHTTHTWDGGVVTKAATETEEGIRTFTCTGCGETKTEAIAKLPHTTHTWDAGIVTKAATETEAGVKTFTCTGCGETRTEAIAKLSHTHTWDAGIVTKAATETEEGVRTFTCTGCKETRTEAIARLTPSSATSGTSDTSNTGDTDTDTSNDPDTANNGRTSNTPNTSNNGRSSNASNTSNSGRSSNTSNTSNSGRSSNTSNTSNSGRSSSASNTSNSGRSSNASNTSNSGRSSNASNTSNTGRTSNTSNTANTGRSSNTSNTANSGRSSNTSNTANSGRSASDNSDTANSERSAAETPEPIRLPVRSADGSHTHDWVSAVSSAPNTRQSGAREYVCMFCGEAHGESIARLSCSHTGTGRTQVPLRAVSRSGCGYAGMVCKDCGQLTGTVKTHAYEAYTVSLADGKTDEVYGYFEDNTLRNRLQGAGSGMILQMNTPMGRANRTGAGTGSLHTTSMPVSGAVFHRLVFAEGATRPREEVIHILISY